MSQLNKKFSVDDVFRASFCMMDYLLRDENVQVNGWIMLSDMTGFSAKHEAVFGLDRMKRSMNVWQVISCQFGLSVVYLLEMVVIFTLSWREVSF